jgi:hypothetical protein
VFESYDKGRFRRAFSGRRAAGHLFPMREIETEPEKAARVLRSIPQKMGQDALFFVQKAFLTFY